MKKIILILGTIVCVLMICVNIVINTQENNVHTTLRSLSFIQTANAEETPADGYYYMIGNCIVCTPGSGACYVSLQCCYNQQPFCDF